MVTSDETGESYPIDAVLLKYERRVAQALGDAAGHVKGTGGRLCQGADQTTPEALHKARRAAVFRAFERAERKAFDATGDTRQKRVGAGGDAIESMLRLVAEALGTPAGLEVAVHRDGS